MTLLVTPQDAERIALAQAEGQIMLVLRNPLDTEPTATSGVRTPALFGRRRTGALRSSHRVSAAQATGSRRRSLSCATASVYTVEAIRAAKRTEEEVVR